MSLKQRDLAEKAAADAEIQKKRKALEEEMDRAGVSSKKKRPATRGGK
jgi:hypothetical protein